METIKNYQELSYERLKEYKNFINLHIYVEIEELYNNYFIYDIDNEMIENHRNFDPENDIHNKKEWLEYWLVSEDAMNILNSSGEIVIEFGGQNFWLKQSNDGVLNNHALLRWFLA